LLANVEKFGDLCGPSAPPGAVAFEEALDARLDAFLTARGVTRGQLLAQLDEPFGAPLLVAAVGSIMQGVGNRRSDLDLIVIVPKPVARMPAASYVGPVLIDPAYFSVDEAERWLAIRESRWPARGPVDLPQWGRYCEQLSYATRFAFGRALAGTDRWIEWMQCFRDSWLIERVCQWWRVESVRKRVAARWLLDQRPLLAAQRELEAVLALLEVRAAAAGLHFIGPKWLAEKLKAIGDGEALEILRACLRAPRRTGEVEAHVERCEAACAALSGSSVDPSVAWLSYLPDVDGEHRDGRVFFHRGNVRGVALADMPAVLPGQGQPLWCGRADADPPRAARVLFAADLCWLSIGAGGA